MHALRTAAMSPAAFPPGIALVAAASLVVMRLLFGRPIDAHRARVHAFLWPPVIGALVGPVVDRFMWLTVPDLELAFLGVRFHGDLAEIVAVAVLSAAAGLLGAALLVPQIIVITRARSAPDDAAARLTRLASRLALATWAIAFAIAAASDLLASRREQAAASVLVALAAIGLCGQALRWWLSREPPMRLAAVPYR
jgi:hypothetical protein